MAAQSCERRAANWSNDGPFATELSIDIHAELMNEAATIRSMKTPINSVGKRPTAQSSGHEWVSIGEGMYGYCSCDTNYIKQVMTRPMWQAHVTSAAQAAQPASRRWAGGAVHKDLRRLEIMHENARSRALAREFAAFIRTHQAARERELREELEGLVLVHQGLRREQEVYTRLDENGNKCCCAGEANVERLRALLASHWPAQKESK